MYANSVAVLLMILGSYAVGKICLQGRVENLGHLGKGVTLIRSRL